VWARRAEIVEFAVIRDDSASGRGGEDILARWARTIQDRESELPRILVLGTWVNKGKKSKSGV
jgi:hypothetical protein